MIDVVVVRQQVVAHLAQRGWHPRDADGSDFAGPGSDLRFKVGTSRGEVAVTTWQDGSAMGAMRVISPESLDLTLDTISLLTGDTL